MAAAASAVGCFSNPETPAGYVGYVTRGAVFGKTTFYGLQTGPTSTGLGWMLQVVNVSVTPYTYTEEFTDEEVVLAKDNLNIGFRVHVVWRVNPEEVRVFVERFSTMQASDKPDQIVRVAYDNYLKEPLRTYARDEVQRRNGLQIKEEIAAIGAALSERVVALTAGTPFEVTNVVVGNIQYPAEVAAAVAKKMATTQLLEQKATEIQIEEAERKKRVVQAQGIAEAMQIINARLTAAYIQHEAIEAQKAMVGSPNHTTVYLPVGPMGVPIVGAMSMPGGTPKASEGR